MNEKTFELHNLSWECNDCTNLGTTANSSLTPPALRMLRSKVNIHHPLSWVPYEALLQKEIIQLPRLIHIDLDEHSCLG